MVAGSCVWGRFREDSVGSKTEKPPLARAGDGGPDHLRTSN